MDKLDKYGKVMSVETYKFYYWFQRVLVFLFYQILWGVKIEGQENVSFSETYIILSNHCSNVDPPLVGFAVKRPIAYMAKSELFKVPILKQIIHWSGAYAVKRKAGDKWDKLLHIGKGIVIPGTIGATSFDFLLEIQVAVLVT